MTITIIALSVLIGILVIAIVCTQIMSPLDSFVPPGGTFVLPEFVHESVCRWWEKHLGTTRYLATDTRIFPEADDSASRRLMETLLRRTVHWACKRFHVLTLHASSVSIQRGSFHYAPEEHAEGNPAYFAWIMTSPDGGHVRMVDPPSNWHRVPCGTLVISSTDDARALEVSAPYCVRFALRMSAFTEGSAAQRRRRQRWHTRSKVARVINWIVDK